jgi:hypothetical protein
VIWRGAAARHSEFRALVKRVRLNVTGAGLTPVVSTVNPKIAVRSGRGWIGDVAASPLLGASRRRVRAEWIGAAASDAPAPPRCSASAAGQRKEKQRWGMTTGSHPSVGQKESADSFVVTLGNGERPWAGPCVACGRARRWARPAGLLAGPCTRGLQPELAGLGWRGTLGHGFKHVRRVGWLGCLRAKWLPLFIPTPYWLFLFLFLIKSRPLICKYTCATCVLALRGRH